MTVRAFYHEGEHSQAVCTPCGTVMSTTFKRRDVLFSDGSGTAYGILVGVCDRCDAVASIPAQSTDAICAARLGRPADDAGRHGH